MGSDNLPLGNTVTKPSRILIACRHESAFGSPPWHDAVRDDSMLPPPPWKLRTIGIAEPL